MRLDLFCIRWRKKGVDENDEMERWRRERKNEERCRKGLPRMDKSRGILFRYEMSPNSSVHEGSSVEMVVAERETAQEK